MKHLIHIKACFLLLAFCHTGHAQECMEVDGLGDYIETNLKRDFAEFDSLNLTIFVKFRVNASGSLDSIWVNGPEMGDVDYDRYIRETKAMSLKMRYALYKKEYLIKKAIFKLLRADSLQLCTEKGFDGFYLLPLVFDFRSVKPHFHHENLLGALNALFTPGVEQYYFLKPVKVGRPCKNCL